MPAKKAARQSVKRGARNRSARTINRTILATAARSIESGDTAVAEQAVLVAISSLDRAVQKGVIHKNTASRRKSRLSIKLNRLKVAGASEAETPAARAPRRRSTTGARQTSRRST
ncbi:MAG: 30S ribosomal protein S20 [SAR202 cluster bacterium Io17-Chloro-G9]|nr:MAG: 30S ribosomal protein S20 [SAR202 cluster bacterium Io17-Chloro-G9]